MLAAEYIWTAGIVWSAFLLTCLANEPHKRNRREAEGANSDFSPYQADWWQEGQNQLRESLNTGFYPGVAKNTILFLGDGMGPSTVTAARIYQYQYENPLNFSYKDSVMAWERFPHTAISRTYNIDSHVPDSAGTATAYLCGEKSRYGVIGVNQRVTRSDCASQHGNELKSILKHAQDEGKWTGIVTTTRVTHASPAASYASSANRNWESDQDIPTTERGLGCQDIAAQLIRSEYGRNIRVILGGGRREFYPEGVEDPEGADRSAGQRLDGAYLTTEWRDNKLNRLFPTEQVHYVQNKTAFDAIDTDTAQFVLGLFEASHMRYELDREDPEIEVAGEPSLEEMTEKAIRILSKNPNGFFLFVEGGRIDHGHHANLPKKALADTVMLSKAVKKASELTDPAETLTVVTADHSHAFTVNGYATTNADLLGTVDARINEGEDDKPYSTLSYANGPGWHYHREETGFRRDLRGDAASGDMRDKAYLFDSAVPLEDETHGGEDVGIYAQGAMSHLFAGVKQQHFIMHAMMYAACIGPNKGLCETGPLYPGCPNKAASNVDH